jgi:hypothetical protein
MNMPGFTSETCLSVSGECYPLAALRPATPGRSYRAVQGNRMLTLAISEGIVCCTTY